MLRSVNRRDRQQPRHVFSSKGEIMRSRRIAILATGAVAFLAGAPVAALAATHTHSHAAAVTRSDSSGNVNGKLDRSRTDTGRLDSSSSPDHSGVSHDTSRG
jgi:hypothetical protein